MYLGKPSQYYQSSNNLPRRAQTFDFELKSCFVSLNTSSRSARWLVSVSLFLALCWTPRLRSARCSVVSGGYLNTLTFVGPVLISFYPLRISFPQFHSFEILSISTFLTHVFSAGVLWVYAAIICTSSLAYFIVL